MFFVQNPALVFWPEPCRTSDLARRKSYAARRRIACHFRSGISLFVFHPSLSREVLNGGPMSTRDYLQLALYLGILLATAKPMGVYMDKVYSGQKTWLSSLFGGVERTIYKICGIDPQEDQSWSRYALHLLAFSLVAVLFTFAIIYFQQRLPLNPQGFDHPSWHLTFNTAISFMTNTNWQAYGGQSTMSYLSQMVALTFQNFASAGVGMAVAVAVIRGIANRQKKGIGNFWADLVRSNLYILLPICVVFAVFLISQGMIQNFLPYHQVQTMEGAK